MPQQLPKFNELEPLDDCLILVCAKCSADYLHIENVSLIKDPDDKIVQLNLSCESCEKETTILQILHHEGRTYMSYVNKPRPATVHTKITV